MTAEDRLAHRTGTSGICPGLPEQRITCTGSFGPPGPECIYLLAHFNFKMKPFAKRRT